MADTDDTPDLDPRDVEKPRGRTSLLTVILIFFNLVAVGGFGTLLYLDIDKREQWTRAVLLRDLYIYGLPVDEADLGTNAEAAFQVKHDLDPPLIKEIYTKQRGLNVKDEFIYVRENFSATINYADITEPILKEYYDSVGVTGGNTKVKSLKEEVADLKNRLPNELDTAAKAAADQITARGKELDDKAGKDPEVKIDGKTYKRAMLRRILFPLAREGWQVTPLEKKIQETEDDKLDAFLLDACKRRMLFDILLALETFRPSEPEEASKALTINDKGTVTATKRRLVDEAADLAKVKYEQLQDHFNLRCDQFLAANDWITPTVTRDNAEKRRTVAFLLLTVANVELPGADRNPPVKKDDSNQPPPEQKKDDNKKDDAEKKDDKGQVAFFLQPPEGEKKEPPEGEKKEPPEGEKPKEEPKAKERPYRPFAFQTWDAPTAEKRVEAIVGAIAFSQACEDLAIVQEILEKKTIEAVERDRGTYAYPLAMRIYDVPRFCSEMALLLQQLNLLPREPKNDADRKKIEGFKAALKERLEPLKGKIDSAETLLAEVYPAMASQQIGIPDEDKSGINKLNFELAVENLLNTNAEGFLGKHRMAILRIQKLATWIEARRRQFDEVKALRDKREELLKAREGQEGDLKKLLTEARKESRDLARDLEYYQDELFNAQVQLAGAHAYNQYLHDRLRDVERKALRREKDREKEKKGQ